MKAERNCREYHIKTYNKNLEEFVVEPGETLETSLSRAVTWHIHNTTFSEIARVVSKKRLEVAIAQLQSELEDDQLKLMYELLGQAACHREGFASRLIANWVRASLRQKLQRILKPHQYLIVCAYEHHLEHSTKPSSSKAVPLSIFDAAY